MIKLLVANRSKILDESPVDIIPIISKGRLDKLFEPFIDDAGKVIRVNCWFKSKHATLSLERSTEIPCI